MRNWFLVYLVIQAGVVLVAGCDDHRYYESDSYEDRRVRLAEQKVREAMRKYEGLWVKSKVTGECGLCVKIDSGYGIPNMVRIKFRDGEETNLHVEELLVLTEAQAEAEPRVRVTPDSTGKVR